MSKKVKCDAQVCLHEQIGPRFYKLGLEFAGLSAEAFRQAVPGQFCEIDLSKLAIPQESKIPKDLKNVSSREVLLRRPFSFCDIYTKGENTVVEILYCVLGPGTVRMTTLKKGDTVSVIGPLGRGFSVPKGKTAAFLVAGGMGAPPLQHLALYLSQNFPEIELIAFAGAKTKEELPFDPQRFAKCKLDAYLATEDGSIGYMGFVTSHLEQWLEKNKTDPEKLIIYTCGPEPMLAKVAQIAEKYKIDCQISMERMMACGIGLCQSCAVECKSENSEDTEYKLCCKDGPVFDSTKVVFEK